MNIIPAMLFITIIGTITLLVTYREIKKNKENKMK